MNKHRCIFKLLFAVFLLFIMLIFEPSVSINASSHASEKLEIQSYVPGQLIIGMIDPVTICNTCGSPNGTEEYTIATLFPGVDIISISDITKLTSVITVNEGKGKNIRAISRGARTHLGRQIFYAKLATCDDIDLSPIFGATEHRLSTLAVENPA